MVATLDGNICHQKKVFFQPGDVVNLTWNARLSEQLGVFKF